MRALRAIVLTMAVAALTPAMGQVPQGPLADPGAPPAAAAPLKSKPAKKPRPKHRKTAATPRTPSDRPQSQDASAADAIPTSRAAHKGTTSSDPVSFGMKWNGSNDTAEKTRVQNYNGDATGAGAAVGLKLHF